MTHGVAVLSIQKIKLARSLTSSGPRSRTRILTKRRKLTMWSLLKNLFKIPTTQQLSMKSR